MFVQRNDIGSITSAFFLPQEGMPLDLLSDDDPDLVAFLAGGRTVQPLTARQLRLGLVTNGIMLDQVEAAIAAVEDVQAQALAKIEWEYASQFERDHPLIAQVGLSLGLDEAMIDAMWLAALDL